MIIYRTSTGEIRRAKTLNLGPGILLVEDDTGLPEVQLDVSGELVTGLTEGLTPDECIPVNAGQGFVLELSNQPSAKTYYDVFMRPWYDPSQYVSMRLVTDIQASGAAGGALMAEYSLDPQAGTWAQAGQQPVYVPLGVQTGPTKGAWQYIASGALTDVTWRVVSISGDNAASPIVGFVALEFTRHPPVVVTTDRWYFRTTDAVFDPTTEMPSMAGGTIPCDMNCPHWWGQSCFAAQPWSTPSTPLADVRSILRGKGAATAGIDCTQPGNNFDDWESGIARFVTPPLAAQTIYPFEGEIGFNADCKNGAGTGMLRFGVHVVRPGVGVVASFFTASCPKSQIFRYDPRDWVLPFSWSSQVDVQDNDRIVVDVTCRMETIGLVLLGIGCSFYYNGTSDNIISGLFGSQSHGQKPASYITLPDTLLTLSDTA